MYLIFDKVIESSIGLPELTHVQDAVPDIRFNVEAGGSPGREDWHRVHDWKLPGGQITISCARRGEDYLLIFPRLAQFLISGNAQAITCFPANGTNDATVRHLLLDQVVPRLAGHLGSLVLHASAVTFDRGAAVAFIGNTGWGKSTLASGFYRMGAQLVTDDCLLIERHAGLVHGIPGYPGLRLWPDSLAELFPGSQGQSRLAQYGDKRRVNLPDGRNSRVGLKALFLLSDPHESGGACGVTIESASGREAVMAMIASLFTLDVEDKARATRNFFECGRVFNSGIPVWHLGYPRSHSILSDVCERVLQQLEESTVSNG